jgi:hypothetical protein
MNAIAKVFLLGADLMSGHKETRTLRTRHCLKKLFHMQHLPNTFSNEAFKPAMKI